MRTLAFLFALAAVACADEVELTNGEVIRDCKVVAEGDGYRIHKGPGSRWVARSEVKSITTAETLDDQYLKKSKDLKDDDVEGRLKLAKWCTDRGLPERAKDEYRKIIAAEPDHEDARTALGYQRHMGQWLTEEEINVAKGLVKHKGKWVTPEERDLDVALEQLKETEKKYYAEVKRWVDRLSSSDAGKVQEAKDSLGKLDDKYKVKHYVTALRSSSKGARLFAAEELRRIKDELNKTGDAAVLSAVKQLVRLNLWDESIDVRAATFRALDAIAHPQTGDCYIPYLAEESTLARMRAEDAIGHFKAVRAVPTMLVLLVRAGDTLRFIEQYEKQIAQVIKDTIVLKSGQKIIAPANVKIAPNLFDPESKRRLAEERDTIIAALRALSGQDYGADAAKWKAWYDAQKK